VESTGGRTAAEIGPSGWREYVAATRERARREAALLSRRRSRAWELARAAAGLLRQKYGASRVVVFGSLVHPGRFTRWSDVDLAAWGLDPDRAMRAVMEVHELDAEIRVNLVEAETAHPHLLAVIEEEGQDI
jgi:predicted nucleotidyltransferase